MASKYKLETRDERIERMHRDNQNRSLELCAIAVDRIWEKRRDLIVSRVPERFKDASMADLGYLTDRIINATEEMLKSPVHNDKVGIIFSGPAGSGKTHAAYALIKMLAEKNPESIAFMASYSQALATLKGEIPSGISEEMGSTWDRLNNESGMYDGILFVDDISSQKLTDFEIDKLTMIVEKRVNFYLPFLFTTNVKTSDFKNVFGERLASRLFGYCEIIEFEGRDRRLEEK